MDTLALLAYAAATNTPSWTSYTPVWGATGGTPSVGNGTLTGRYMLLGPTGSGKTCVVEVSLGWGSTTTANSGALWTFSLPVQASASTLNAIVPARCYNGNFTMLMGRIAPGATIIDQLVVVNPAGTSNTLSYNVPFTWVSPNSLTLSTVYETV